MCRARSWWKTVALGILVAAAGCSTRLTSATFRCDKDVPDTCPPGWLCQCRGAGCQWRCYAESGGYCGNKQLDEGEECEGLELGGNTCTSLGRGDGFAVCTTECTIYCTICGNGQIEVGPDGKGEECDDGNTEAGDGCSPRCLIERCGNELIDPGEVCDDGNNVSGDGCSADCKSHETCGNGYLDLTTGEQCDCSAGAAPLPAGCAGPNGSPAGHCTTECRNRFCGNGQLDPGEWCDDGNTRWGDGCSADCQSDETCGNGYVDTARQEACDCGTDPARLPSGCSAINGDGASECTAHCGLRYCGNGELDPGEACDDGDTVSGDGCSADCKSRESCGNGIVDAVAGELCDESSGNSNAPDATCRGDCRPRRCGDGIVDPAANEECDGSLGGKSCADFGYYGGVLRCTGCRYEVTGCMGRCGDGVRGGSEACDGSDFGGATCHTYGYYTGQLSCTQGCAITAPSSTCQQRCGDGERNGPEQCDGVDFGGFTCATYGRYAGALSCDSSCVIVSAQCHDHCGDGVRNGPEVCDQGDLGGFTCGSYGYHTGTLACDATCGGISTAECAQYCGDGIVNGSELCDGLGRVLSCADFGYVAGAIACNGFCERSFAPCLAQRWEPIDTGTGPSAAITGIWAASPADIFAATGDGTIRRYNGSSWRVVYQDWSLQVTGLWGHPAPLEVFAVGSSAGAAAAVYYNGTDWTPMGMGGETDPLRAVGGTPPDVFAVGDNGTIMRRAGASFVAVTSNTAEHLYGVHVRAPGDAYAVGENGTIMRYNGSAWSAADSGTTVKLMSIWGDAQDLLIGGGSGVMLRANGSGFETMPSGTAYGVFTLWGTAADDVYQGGPYGQIFHWDGATWTRMSTPATAQYIYAIGGSSATDVWAGPAADLMLHWRGFGWRPLAGTGTVGMLEGVWAPRPDLIYAAGRSGVMRFNGTGWSSPVSGYFNGIWGASESAVFAVGGDGLAARSSGGSWVTETACAATHYYAAVGGSSSSDVWAAGWEQGTSNGVLCHFNGTSWQTVPPGTSAQLTAVWSDGPDRGYIVGTSGTILRYQGTSLAPVLPSGPHLYGVWGTHPADVYAVGEGGTVLHYDGSSWTTVPTGTDAWLLAIGGSSATDIFAVGYGGTVLHFDGTAFSRMETDTADRLAGVAAPSRHGAFATGDGGIRRFRADLAPPRRGACSAPVRIYCQSTLHGSTVNQPTFVKDFACPGAATELGPQVIYELESPVKGPVQVTLTPTGGDLDLIVTGADQSGACDAAAHCIAPRQTAGSDVAEVVTFPAEAGSSYFFFVGGRQPADTAAYSLRVDCTKE